MRNRRLALIVTAAALVPSAVAISAASAGASQPRIGTVPPADPTYYCDPGLASALANINYCRAKEGIGPMVLPSNFDSLTPPQQQLVAFNLERINRGEPAIVGLNAALNTLSQSGADANGDPNFPADLTGAGGSIWAANSSTLDALDAWMYTDECTPTSLVGCWGHRDNILMNSDNSSTLVAGAGYTANGWHSGNFSANSYAALFVYGYHPDQLTFTWADELAFFAVPPATEPLNGPTSSPSPTPSQTPTPTPTPTPSATPTPTPTPSQSSTPSPTPSSSMTSSASPTPSPAPQTRLTRVTRNESTRKFTPFPHRLTVSATRDGVPVEGLRITFTVTTSRGYRSQVSARTNAAGVARMPSITAGSPGLITVTASAKKTNTVTWRLHVVR